MRPIPEQKKEADALIVPFMAEVRKAMDATAESKQGLLLSMTLTGVAGSFAGIMGLNQTARFLRLCADTLDALQGDQN